MARKRKVAKTSEQRLRDCEVHLHFLEDALALYPQQPDRYKQIAAELRVLVCETKSNRPIMLDLMDEFGFFYAVQPPGPPFDKAPIQMVGWKSDNRWAELREKIGQLTSKRDIERILQEQAKLRRPVPLREYVDRALAVYIAPYDYSYKDLTLAVSQQLGSSHEDESVEEPIAQLQSIFIGGHPSHIAPLLGFATLVLNAGSAFFSYLEEIHGYERRPL